MKIGLDSTYINLFPLERQQFLMVYSFVFKMADKLLASFGQDVLDALFWTATEPRGRRREHIGIVPHFVLTLCYISIFSFVDDLHW